MSDLSVLSTDAYRYDLSIVLNLHREGKYLKRTLASLKEAVLFARHRGVSIDVVIVLDSADAVTTTLTRSFDFSCAARLEIVETSVASLGLARNVGVANAQGEWIALCDGDDLVSFNYFHACLMAARHFGPGTMLMPQWYVGFGTNLHFCEFAPLDTVTPLAFLDVHPYGSRTFAHASVYAAVPFGDASAASGFAFEDWHHNSEVVAAGFDIQIARNAVIFYRQRASGLMGVIRSSTQTAQIPPSRLFRPEVFRAICRDAVERLSNKDDTRATYPASGDAIFDDPTMLAFMSAANRIDPGIDPVVLRESPEYPARSIANLDVGIAYFHVCARLEHRSFTDVVLVPVLDHRDSRERVVNLVSALVDEGRTVLVLAGEAPLSDATRARLPDQVELVDLHMLPARIGVESVGVIALKLVQSYPAAFVHVEDGAFGRRFVESFGRIIPNRVNFYMSCELRHVYDGLVFTNDAPFHFVSENLTYLDKVVTDSRSTIFEYVDRLGVAEEKFHVLPHFCEPTKDSEAANPHPGSDRILWASRCDFRKRPSLISKIAALLEAWNPAIVVDLYSDGAWDVADRARLQAHSNVVLHENEDFTRVLDDAYLCMIYTSVFDGIPTEILAAAGAGIPVIAPDVGGIREHIGRDQAGILLPSLPDDDDMAAAYVRAVRSLQADPGRRASIIAAAYRSLAANHAHAPYRMALARILAS